jgi:RNA polymerase sigma factor (sigma-70 family)
MANAQVAAVLKHIRRLTVAQSLQRLPDRQLLQLFAVEREEAAFAALVQRHAQRVWSVCRHVLHHEQDAEDAFQASFLVLARHATSVRKAEALASWLHGVAYRIAMTVKRNAAVRALRERQRSNMPREQTDTDLAWRELQALLDEEVTRLPEKYRVPFVLCCLDQKSKAEAAAQLGWKEGTVSSRLAQARKLLQQRMVRRGLTLSAVLCSAGLTAESASAAIPALLVETTIRAVLVSMTAKVTAAGMLSAQATALAEGVSKAMFATKCKILTALVLAVTILSTSTGLVARQALATRSADSPQGNTPQNPTEKAAREFPDDDELPANLQNLPEATRQALVRKVKVEVLPNLFRDMTAESTGIHFTYQNGEEADQYTILESLGGGVALIDYDRDGLLDIFLPGGGEFVGEDKKEIKGRPCKLFKNLGRWTFKDVTAEVGLDHIPLYTHGAAVTDYDCDGWPDLLVTGYGGVMLFHNEPDGKGGRRFVDVTNQAGLTDKRWATSAAWADLDGDGYPDLYLCHYVDWSMDNNPICDAQGKGTRDICPPRQFKSLSHTLYRNNGDGTFTDVSKEAGLRPRDASEEAGKGTGVVIVDVDGDGKPDIYVANDTVDNFLYLNHSAPGKIRLEEVGMHAGVARDDRGTPNGSMGLDAADFNGSGKPSIWVTNYEAELHALYVNMCDRNKMLFRFGTQAAGIAALGQTYVGHGTGFLDIDNDGWEDLFISNGHTIRHPIGALRQQRPVLLRNLGNGKFANITAQGGEYFRTEHLGRGVAVGDLDNDGRPDLVISHLNEPVVLLRNVADTEQHWLGIELIGKDHHDVVGARVVVEIGDRKLTRFAKGGGSYLSSGDRRLLFGLGKAKQIDRLTVFWPNGQEQQWSGDQFKNDRYWKLTQGKETPE